MWRKKVFVFLISKTWAFDQTQGHQVKFKHLGVKAILRLLFSVVFSQINLGGGQGAVIALQQVSYAYLVHFVEGLSPQKKPDGQIDVEGKKGEEAHKGRADLFERYAVCWRGWIFLNSFICTGVPLGLRLFFFRGFSYIRSAVFAVVALVGDHGAASGTISQENRSFGRGWHEKYQYLAENSRGIFSFSRRRRLLDKVMLQ